MPQAADTFLDNPIFTIHLLASVFATKERTLNVADIGVIGTLVAR